MEYTKSSGNVFADMGFPDAEELLLKAQLATAIQTLLDTDSLTQTELAERIGLTQPNISNLRRGRLEGFSVERLFHILSRLGQEVEKVH